MRTPLAFAALAILLLSQPFCAVAAPLAYLSDPPAPSQGDDPALHHRSLSLNPLNYTPMGIARQVVEHVAMHVAEKGLLGHHNDDGGEHHHHFFSNLFHHHSD